MFVRFGRYPSPVCVGLGAALFVCFVCWVWVDMWLCH